MEDSGNWLYIILAVIAGISGLISSARKKKQQQQQAEVLSQPVPFEEEDWLPTFKPQQQSPSTKKGKKVKAQNTARTYQPIAVTPSQVDLFKDETSEDITPLISAETFQDAEEVKKAIIYSEIFNRKY